MCCNLTNTFVAPVPGLENTRVVPAPTLSGYTVPNPTDSAGSK